MKWDHHKGTYRFDSSDRQLSPPAGAMGITIDGRLTLGFSGECHDDNPEPSDHFTVVPVPLTAAEREEIANEMISRWMKWLFTDGFPGSCQAEKHFDAIKVPGIVRSLCTCSRSDGGPLSPEAARLLKEGMDDVLAGRVAPGPPLRLDPSQRPEFTITTRPGAHIDIVFPDANFLPEQYAAAKQIVQSYYGMKMDDGTVRDLRMRLEIWLDGLIARGDLAFNPFEQRWMAPWPADT